MKVLIVEDDENKRLQFDKFFREFVPVASVQMERSLQSGVRRVRKDCPDLILLDMTLPNYDTSPEESGGQLHIFGGREFLRQMDRFDIAVPVIVVTQFETFGKAPQQMTLTDLDRELRKEHPTVYRGFVYYHAAIHGWKQKLLKLIQQTSNRKDDQNTCS